MLYLLIISKICSSVDIDSATWHETDLICGHKIKNKQNNNKLTHDNLISLVHISSKSIQENWYVFNPKPFDN